MHQSLHAATIYVSPSLGQDRSYCGGHDGLSPVPDGAGSGPFRTIGAALNAAKDLRTAGVTRPLTVALCEDIFLDKPLHITVPGVTLTSYGRRRRISGGHKLEGWNEDIFNGVSCLSHTLPERRSGWDFTDLYVNGLPAVSPRFPAEGTLRAIACEHDVCTHLGENVSSKWFVANTADLEGVTGIDTATVNYYHYWIDEHSPVESYDPASGKLVMQYASRFGINTTYAPEEHSGALNYYLTNIPSQFGKPGEWYLDRAAGKVYYIPRDGESAEALTVYAPETDCFFTVTGEDIHIRGLDFCATRCEYVSRIEICTETDPGKASPEIAYASDGQSVCGAPGAIRFRDAIRCSLSDCRLENVGIYAVEIGAGSRAVRIEDCKMGHLAAGGVKIIGGKYTAPADRKTSGCSVRRCHIHHCGERYAAGCGVLICHASEIEVADCHIHHLDYTGISVGWEWGYGENTCFGNLIRGNHIHHVGMGRLSDMGGIYLLGRQPGTVVCENRIHDVTSAHYGGWGIYTDEGSSFMRIERNVIYNTKCESYHQHYGSCNTVRNNVFAFGGGGVRLSRNELHDGILFEGNIFLLRGKPAYNDTALAPLSARGNLFWDVSGTPRLYKDIELSLWQEKYGQDRGSAVADPRFADPENYDFTLRPDSPALSMGFEPLTGFLATGKD